MQWNVKIIIYKHLNFTVNKFAQKNQAGLDFTFNLIAIVIKYPWNKKIFFYPFLSNAYIYACLI